MKICSYCGRTNDDLAPSCRECGTNEFKGVAAEPLVQREARGATKAFWTCVALLFVWLAIDHRTSLPAYVKFWIGLLLLIVSLVLACMTRNGRLIGVMVLGLALGVAHQVGKTAEWVVTAPFALACISVYCRRQYLRRSCKPASNHERT